MRQRTVRPRAVALLLVPLLILGLVGGMPVPAQAIANGQDVPDGGFPFAVKLTMTGIPERSGALRNSSCSGSLLTPSWVITAGHCFKTYQGVHVSRPVARKTTATVGRADLGGPGGHVSTVVAVRQSATADVSLAKIDPPITDIAPIHLRASAPTVGTIVHLAGFGDTGRNEPVAERLQTGQFKVVSRSAENFGVVGYRPRDTTSPCAHDSGGPYFTQVGDGPAELVGVVSYGPTCPHTGADESARIDTIEPWIRSVVGAQNLNRPIPAAVTPARVSGQTGSAGSPARGPDAARQVSTARESPLGGGPLVWSIVAVLVAAGLVAVLRGRTRSRRVRDPYEGSGIRSHRRS